MCDHAQKIRSRRAEKRDRSHALLCVVGAIVYATKRGDVRDGGLRPIRRYPVRRKDDAEEKND